MAQIKNSVTSDFALFDAIFNEAEAQAQSDDLFFHVSPVRTPDDTKTNDDAASTWENKPPEKQDSIESCKSDNVNQRHEEEEKEKVKEEEEEELSNKIVESKHYKTVETYQNEETSSLQSDDGVLSDSSSSNNESIDSTDKYKELKNVRFEREKEVTKPNEALSKSIEYDGFREYMRRTEDGWSDLSSKIDQVADENKQQIFKRNHNGDNKNTGYCECPNCPNNIYIKSNFPLLKTFLSDEDIRLESSTKKKKKRRKRKTSRNKTKRANVDQPNPSQKTKLDARLDNSSNPVLLDWLESKKELERNKRRQEKKEKKLRTSDTTGASNSFIDDEKKQKLQDWIERKKKEIKEKKKRISAHLDVDKTALINHLKRPQTAATKRSPRFVTKTATESKDILAKPLKIRPKSSPYKRTSKTKEENFVDFHETFLKNEEIPNCYASVRLFVESIVNSSIEELERENRVKQVRFRPKAERQSGVVWRQSDSSGNELRVRPVSSISRQSNSTDLNEEMAYKTTSVKPRPFTSISRPRGQNIIANVIPEKSHEAWLAEQRIKDKSKLKFIRKKTYYDAVEARLIEEEHERRRRDLKELNVRINSGLKRGNESKENINKHYHATMFRPEPQGSENKDRISKEEAGRKAFPSLPPLRASTPLVAGAV